MTEVQTRKSWVTVLISILMIILFGMTFQFWKAMNDLHNTYSDLNQMESIGSLTQRLISFGVLDKQSEKDIFYIGDTTEKALMPQGEDALTVLHDPDMLRMATDVLESWYWIKSLLESEEHNLIDIELARELHFKTVTTFTLAIKEEADSFNEKATRYQVTVFSIFFAMAMIMLNSLFCTQAALKQSKLLAKTAQIDLATGLYNRSKCQELFKSTQNLSDTKHPGLLVLDINDLKKTNDHLGYRCGDELIASFSDVLKNACDVHMSPHFVARYGGDEFVVYYDNVSSEDEIQTYIKELTYLTEQFNENETRFQISYAVGYAFMKKGNEEQLTVRQLFDKADAAMYENKLARKRAINPDYDIMFVKGDVR